MWTPANRHILPSAQEAQNIKRTIKLLETELVAARELLERTQERITELERNLEQGKATISPIRSVPTDVLSGIFQICCIEERLAPLTIAAVCYRWRETIIGTPLAWTRIFPQNNPTILLPNEYVSLFLERSQPCLLHIAVPWPRDMCVCSDRTAPGDIRMCDCLHVETIFEHAARIQCLNVDVEWMVEYSTVLFENLTGLIIVAQENGSFFDTTSPILDVSRFPKLYYLSISSGANKLIDFSHVTQSQLKHLDVDVDGEEYWLDIIKTCASSLQTLIVYGNFTSSAQSIEFPRLESLIVRDVDGVHTVDGPVLEVIAPDLAFFEATCTNPRIMHHCKFHRITHLRTKLLPSLHDYPLLRVLHVPNLPGMIDGILVQLERELNICPGLETIELSTTRYPRIPGTESHGDQLQRRVAERNDTAKSDVELVFNRKSPNNAAVYSPCTKDMPCRLNMKT